MSFAPPRLSDGAEIRCVAPARNFTMEWIVDTEEPAKERLRAEGFNPTLGKNIRLPGPMDSSPIDARLDDLHTAFQDPSVEAILSLVGGYNSNQLLRWVDYDLIKSNPKIICGYSDITAILNAIYAKTGMITYSGPHFLNFAELAASRYTMDTFKRCVMTSEPYEIIPTSRYSEDWWNLDQVNRTWIENPGPKSLRNGTAKGTCIGGNLRTLMQLAGTEYWPGLEDSIVFIEDFDRLIPQVLDQLLESLLNQRDADGIRGLAFGRFVSKSEITNELLLEILARKRHLQDIPIVAALDFGHTFPVFTFPIGGTAQIMADDQQIELKVHTH